MEQPIPVEQIEPCPFCGGKNLVYAYNQKSDGFTDGRIYCKTCTAAKGAFSFWGEPQEEDIKIAISVWNKRGV